MKLTASEAKLSPPATGTGANAWWFVLSPS
jgi:hypothetical protein